MSKEPMTFTKSKKLRLSLYQAMALLVFTVILVSVVAGTLLITKNIKTIVNARLGGDGINVSRTLKESPAVKNALMATPIDENLLNLIVKNISSATNASIVIFDKTQKIVAIYNPTSEAMTNVNINAGTITSFEGLPANFFKNHAIDKIFDDKGEIIGYAIVGFPENVAGEIKDDIFDSTIIAAILSLIVGVLGSYLLAHKIKNILFNYEPNEVASLLEERNALINNVSEAIIAVNKDYNIQFINDVGVNLLKKASANQLDNYIGKSYALLTSTENIEKVLKHGKKIENIEGSLNGLPIVADILPVREQGNTIGVIVSITEKNALQNMAERLTGVSNYADALRAQTHEFMNKMHVINGLLTTGNIDELKKYVHHVSSIDETNTEEITTYIKEPLLSGFLIGKKSRANELQIEFHLDDESYFPESSPPNFSVHDIILIVGNLLENAFDVLRHKKGERIVNLSILTYEDEEIIIVENNGNPIPQNILDKIFEKGFSTKGENHGYGLALIKEKVEELQGKINTESDENGTIFTIQLPVKGDNDDD